MINNNVLLYNGLPVAPMDNVEFTNVKTDIKDH